MDIMPDKQPMENQALLAGLDPANLLRQGVADDTVLDGASSAFHPPAIEELTRIFPQFEILELIGQGGMGAVYKVRQKELDRIVALKILPPGIGQSPEFSNRFTREAKALAKLNHPGIVTLHEFGQQDGLYFILMEFVDGVNLAQLMKTGRISPREALAIVPQICDALQYAHDQGIVHRDIKPENILLNRLGRVKVADFGIAKVVAAVCDRRTSEDDRQRRLQTAATLAGKIIGTPQYMAPEQIEHPSDVDHRADIYALGVVFYQMLTGELPGKDLQAPSQKVHIDVRLDEIVLKAMEKTPQLRYQTVGIFKTQLETIVSEMGSAAVPDASLPVPSNKRPEAGAPLESRFSRTAIAGSYSASNQPPSGKHSTKRAIGCGVLTLVGVVVVGLAVVLPLTLRSSSEEAHDRFMAAHKQEFTEETSRNRAVSPPVITAGESEAQDKGMVELEKVILQQEEKLEEYKQRLEAIIKKEANPNDALAKASHTQEYLDAKREVETQEALIGTMNKKWEEIAGTSFRNPTAENHIDEIPFRELPASNRLQIRMVAPGDSQAVDVVRIWEDGTKTTLKLNLNNNVIVCDQHVKDAGIQKSSDGYGIMVTLNEAGEKRLAAATKGADGKMQLAVIVDGEVKSAPVVMCQLGRQFTVEGFSDHEKCLGIVRDLVEWPDDHDTSAMTGWLEKVHQNKAGEAWTMASEYLRQNLSSEKFVEMIAKARQPLGSVMTRRLSSAKRMESPPGAPDGLYLVSEFDSSFTNKKDAKEFVTLYKEKDGHWRICGYFIR